MVQITLRKIENIIKIINARCKKFEVSEGVRQGDPISAISQKISLFVIY